MKISLKITILLVFIFSNSYSKEAISYSYIGKLEPIWKNQPVIGRWLSQGQGLIKVPEYLQQGSFPYKKRNYEKEVLFTDELSVVRLLGGWNFTKPIGELNSSKEADLLYRKDGKIHYRWELLFKRLDPYINNGYKKLTLVLDNIPWALPQKPKLAFYGQTAPPASNEEWGSFLAEMCNQLLKKYGQETVKNFRFRLGTENQHKKRFSGSYDKYISLLYTTEKAIRKVLPNAKIGIFNHGGGKNSLSSNNINVKKLLSKYQGQIDFIPISSYYIQNNKNKKKSKTIVDQLKMDKNYYKQLVPYSNNMSKEVHEFGIINYVNGDKFSEIGSRGAAWKLYMLLGYLENDFKKVFHWNLLDKIDEDKYLLTSEGWIYSILDYMVGGEAFILNQKPDNNITSKTLFVNKKDKIFILNTIFSNQPNNILEQNYRLNIPSTILENINIENVEYLTLNYQNNVHDFIHSEFLKEGILNKNLENDYLLTGSVKQMGGNKGLNYVSDRWNHYRNKLIESLTTKEYKDIIKFENNILTIEMQLNLPGVYLFILYPSPIN